LWCEVLSGVLHDVYMMWSSQQSVATATVTAAVMRQRFHPVVHELNVQFVRSSCYCRTSYTNWNWNEPQRPAKWSDSWNMKATSKLIEIVKKTTLFDHRSTASNFWATVCKMVRPMLSYRCPVCLSCLLVGVLWPNGGMDQGETWRWGRPRPCPRCVRWGRSSSSPQRGRAPNFRPISVVAKWLDGLRCHLIWR